MLPRLLTRARRALENILEAQFLNAIKTGSDSTILLSCRSITQPFARYKFVLRFQSIPSIALAINFQLLCSATMFALRLLMLSALVRGFAPRITPPRRHTMRHAVEEMYLCDENVEKVLEGAREDMAAVFGYAADSQKVGITGTVELVEIEGPVVIIRLGGRFWHKRSDVVQRVANYLIERIPEICDVEVEDAAQLDDADKLEAKPGGW